MAHVEGERYVPQALSGVPARQGLQCLVARQLQLPTEPHSALSRPSLSEANERVVPVVQLATMHLPVALDAQRYGVGFLVAAAARAGHEVVLV